MRRVFAKEWLQGQMIAMFGLLMGGLVTALWGILTVAYVRNWTDQDAVNGFCGVMYYLVPLVLAAFVGSGLFAAEVERGTMPLLLALPFSRRQVWVGKTLAGLALMLCAVVLVLVPAVIAVRPALEEVDFWTLLPELALATALLYIAALFWSTVLTTIMSALLSAVALVLGLVAVAILIIALGGRLFGPPLLDIELWALAAAPGLLVGSYIGFARGETFRGRRRWVLPLTVAGALSLVVGSSYIGLARWGTRYDRALVHDVEWPQVMGGGKVAGLITFGSPVNLTREVEVKLTGRHGGDRRVYSVCVDLETGKELLVRREAGAPQVSPDGKYAVLLTEPRALTWRGQSWDYSTGPIMEIWDLARLRLTYRGVPRLPGKDHAPLRVGHAEWSPDSRWITLSASTGYDEENMVLLMQPNGAIEFETEVFGEYGERVSWAYAPSGDALYVLGHDGALTRYEPDGKRSKLIWSISKLGLNPEEWLVRRGDVTVSPDGDLIAVSGIALWSQSAKSALETRQFWSTTERKYFMVVMKSDGSQSQVVPDISPQRFAWSRDGNTLFMVLYAEDENRPGDMKVAVWKDGQLSFSEILPTRGSWPAMLPLSDDRLALILPEKAWIVDGQARVTRVTGALEKALSGSRVAGLDKQGRLIVRRPEGNLATVSIDAQGQLIAQRPEGYLAAVGLDTGQVTRIYP